MFQPTFLSCLGHHPKSMDMFSVQCQPLIGWPSAMSSCCACTGTWGEIDCRQHQWRLLFPGSLLINARCSKTPAQLLQDVFYWYSLQQDLPPDVNSNSKVLLSEMQMCMSAVTTTFWQTCQYASCAAETCNTMPSEARVLMCWCLVIKILCGSYYQKTPTLSSKTLPWCCQRNAQVSLCPIWNTKSLDWLIQWD